MPEDPENNRRDGRMPDELWERLVPLLPRRKRPPLGCHRPRGEDRTALHAMFFVLRTGCQWNALQATGLCSSRAAHRRCQAWTAAGVFLALGQSGLGAYEVVQGMDWAWLAREGAMTNAPRGGENGGPASERAREDGGQAQLPHRGRRRAHRPRRGGGQAA
jgi:transposase